MPDPKKTNKLTDTGTGSAKQMMQKRTPVVSGGKAGTIGKYSSDGGRGDVGKRSYGEVLDLSNRSTRVSDPFLKGLTSDLTGGTVYRKKRK